MPFADPTQRRAWNRWWAMIHRCTFPTDVAWANYGGRGITVCDRWMIFENYYADLGDAPEGMTLDRIDNDGNYEPSNVRWATPAEQNRNKRNVGRPACIHGHEFTETNTYRAPGSPYRHCRECKRANKARARIRQAA